MAKNDTEARAAELAARPYTFDLSRGEDGIWTVQVDEFPGAISEGGTPDEAIANGSDALEGVIAVMLERGQSIPEPGETREYSGTLQLRIPPSLHARAAALARRDNVSLNRTLSAAVAYYLGYREASQQQEPDADIASSA